jgi:molecular chaperone DnaK (HSP70)
MEGHGGSAGAGGDAAGDGLTVAVYLRHGIDLGTTNSCIARADGADVRVYQNNDQMSVTPSAVRLLKSGRIITGKRAYNAIVDDPDNIAVEFKRWMGQKGGKTFPAAQRLMTAEALSAEVLKALRDDVARADGEDLRASVVTVPAAFGALQCDATARACVLAGLHQAPLLQEPLAAAIAYGVTSGARDQRWLVFDLGGGTLDIAVVSTRDGRLTVLEHRGNNLLGGKDIDRGIAEHFFIPALAETFELADPATEPAGYQRLMRRLVMTAEEAKIDLSSSERVVVSLVDLGEDARGRPIELELTLTRAELERESESLVDRALRLAEEALAGARIAGKDLDRVLLVGGPTQMPYVRGTISSRLGAKIDHSIDPMTVVGRGAALYAATVEREERKLTSISTEQAAASEKQKLLLAYEPVSAKVSATVAGKLEGTGDGVAEIKIEAEGGYWISGWLPLTGGAFEVAVLLQEGKSSRFFVYARDATGTLIDVEPNELSIRHGLVVAPPPLPHTIAVEVSRPRGKAELDPIFKRGTPLPAERSVRYRSDKACKPGEPHTSLAIKLWEGEELSDAEANVWVGNVKIDAKEIRRPIPEGSEVELTIKIDASRLITIEAFVPHLNQHFSDKLYMAQEEEKDYAELSAAVPEQLGAYRERLEELESILSDGEGTDEQQREDVKRLSSEIDDLHSEADTSIHASDDPDRAKRVVEAARNVRLKLAQMEKASGVDPQISVHMAEVRAARDGATEVVARFGSALEKKELQMLDKQLERTMEKAEVRALRKMGDAFNSLRWRVLFGQAWWWREVFESMQAPGHLFRNRHEAERLFREGAKAIRAGDVVGLQATVRELWKLQPKDEIEQDQERAMRSGLRRY